MSHVSSLPIVSVLRRPGPEAGDRTGCAGPEISRAVTGKRSWQTAPFGSPGTSSRGSTHPYHRFQSGALPWTYGWRRQRRPAPAAACTRWRQRPPGSMFRRAVTAGTPSGVIPDVQALADLTSPEKWPCRFRPERLPPEICTSRDRGVSRAGGNMHVPESGVSGAGPKLHVHSSTGSGARPKMHLQKAVVRGVRQKNARAKNRVNDARRGMHVQASGGSVAGGKWHVHFPGAGTSAARMHVQVCEGSHVDRKTHASASGGSPSGSEAHEPRQGASAAVPGLHEPRTSGSENFQDGWAQKISRVPTQKKFA
jgi:hypothetical protein